MEKGEVGRRQWLLIPMRRALKQFLIISLLTVEGKPFSLFWRNAGLITRRTTTSNSQWGVPVVFGSVENTSVPTKSVREAEERNGNLAGIWVNTALGGTVYVGWSDTILVANDA